MQAKQLIDKVKKLADEYDLLVVTLHADLEFSAHPAPYRRRLARQLIDAGARLVIQHHPHVIQGAESYHHGFIAYSVGNFLFKIGAYQQQCTETRRSAILRINISKTDSACIIDHVDWIPVILDDDGYPKPALEPECSDMLSRIERLSAELKDYRLQRRYWLNRAWHELRRIVFDLYYTGRKNGMRHMWRRMLFLSHEPLTWHCILGCLTLGRR